MQLKPVGFWEGIIPPSDTSPLGISSVHQARPLRWRRRTPFGVLKRKFFKRQKPDGYLEFRNPTLIIQGIKSIYWQIIILSQHGLIGKIDRVRGCEWMGSRS
ncbi:hypothetical protein KEJ49_08095 [Candidatus Bathyarchaeota archaeon]|nr:hypothetical protein [Candidatus Bathyarchaeota archaeon]